MIDFILQKRSKGDIVLSFDGRSRACRKVMHHAVDELGAFGAHAVTECWSVYMMTLKAEDARVLGGQTSFAMNNREAARAEFDTCGESSTPATAYTWVAMPRYVE